MNRVDRKFFNWIFESTILVILAALVGHALDKLLGTRARFLGLLLLAALAVKVWQQVRLYRTSVSDANALNDKKNDGDANQEGPGTDNT